jgi:hypothetical protein
MLWWDLRSEKFLISLAWTTAAAELIRVFFDFFEATSSPSAAAEVSLVSSLQVGRENHLTVAGADAISPLKLKVEHLDVPCSHKTIRCGPIVHLLLPVNRRNYLMRQEQALI